MCDVGLQNVSVDYKWSYLLSLASVWHATQSFTLRAHSVYTENFKWQWETEILTKGLLVGRTRTPTLSAGAFHQGTKACF